MTGQTLLLLLRARHADARQRVLDELRAHGGNVSETAAELGVAVSTLYDWRHRDPELARGFAALAQGREGSRRAAAAARRKMRKKPLSEMPEGGEPAAESEVAAGG